MAKQQQQGLTLHGPPHEYLDRVALQRILANDRAAQHQRAQELQILQMAEQQHVAAIQEKDAALADAAQDLARANMVIEELRQDRDRLITDLHAMNNALNETASQRNQAQKALNVADLSLRHVQRELHVMRQSTTWQVALKLQLIARHLAWAAPAARWLIRLRPGASASDQAMKKTLSG